MDANKDKLASVGETAEKKVDSYMPCGAVTLTSSMTRHQVPNRW